MTFVTSGMSLAGSRHLPVFYFLKQPDVGEITQLALSDQYLFVVSEYDGQFSFYLSSVLYQSSHNKTKHMY